MLRQFLYFDEPLIDDFLAQIEGGAYDEERQRRQDTTARALEGGADLKVVKGSASGGSTVEAENERTLRQVRASKFERLYQALTTSSPPLLRQVTDVGETPTDSLRRGELVEFDADVALPTFVKLLGSISGVSSLLPLMDLVGADTEIPPEMRQMMDGVAAISDALSGEKLPVVATIGRTPFRFICRLARPGLVVPESDLEGEVTVVGKVQRLLREGDRETLVSIPGLSMLPPDQKVALAESMESESSDLGEMVVTYPAAVLTVLAIHR